MASEATERQLREAYYSPESAGSYGGVERLFRAVKNLGIKRADVSRFLASQDPYTLHRPVRRHYTRQKTVVHGVDAQWQADLVDMSALARWNKGNRYILTVIDCFSRFAWAVPVRRKDGTSMRNAFQKLFSVQNRKPKLLQTDEGKEFYNRLVKEELEKHGIRLFSTQSYTKASIVERFNRTLKQRMWTYFTAKNTRRFIDILPALVKSYNESQHRTLGTTPLEASSIRKQSKLWHKLYGTYFAQGVQGTRARARASEGDEVRISKQKATFEKGYLPNWTREVFQVTADGQSGPGRPVYKIRDAAGEAIRGKFYPEEILPISHKKEEGTLYRVESVLRKRNLGKSNEEWFVKWLGWPKKFNSWIKQKSLTDNRE